MEKKKLGTTHTPSIIIENCDVKGNGIVSTDRAKVVVKNTNFKAQHPERYVFTVEEGGLAIDRCNIDCSYFISGSTFLKGATIEAYDSIFRLNPKMTKDRGYLPQLCANCVFNNFGATVKLKETIMKDCIFTRDEDHVIGKYYFSVPSDVSIYLANCAFKSGDDIAYNSPGYIELDSCHYINKIGLNVTNYKEINTIAEDIVK